MLGWDIAGINTLSYRDWARQLLPLVSHPAQPGQLVQGAMEGVVEPGAKLRQAWCSWGKQR